MFFSEIFSLEAISVLQASGASFNKVWTGLINLIRRLKSFAQKWNTAHSERPWATCRRAIFHWWAFLMRINKLLAENMNNVDPNTRHPLSLLCWDECSQSRLSFSIGTFALRQMIIITVLLFYRPELRLLRDAVDKGTKMREN